MLTHSITVHAAPFKAHEKKSRFPGEIGSNKHKRFIFERALEKCKFEQFENVFYKGQRYQIIDIVLDYDKVKWDGLSPMFVELWDCDDDESFLVHPSVLKRKLRN